MQRSGTAKHLSSFHGYLTLLLVCMFASCADSVINEDASVSDRDTEYPNGNINMTFDPLPENGTQPTPGSTAAGSEAGSEMRGGITIVEDPTSGEMMAGEMMAEEMMAGEMMAGEMMAGEVMVEEPPLGQTFPDYAMEMLEYVNEFRRTGGDCGGQSLPSSSPLRLQAQLNQSALAHADDMGRNNYFDHNSQDGRSPWDRIAATGYAGQAFGENIAAGRGDAFSTFEQWRNSPGHCSNMLSGNFTELGVGYSNVSGSAYSHYWVQNFARPR